MFHVLGIDPGNAGALALVNSNEEVVDFWDMPLVHLGKRNQVSAALLVNVMGEVTRAGRPSICYMEKVGAMPKDGAVQAFAFGRGVGVIEGCLAASATPLAYAAPNVWKAQSGLTGLNKDASRAKVLERYPHLADALKRKKDDGRAEAILIALWGLRKELRSRGGDRRAGPGAANVAVPLSHGET